MKHIKFTFLSLIGFIFFLMPFNIAGEEKIALSHIVGYITGHHMKLFMGITVFISWMVIAGTVIFIFHESKSKVLNTLFKTSKLNVLLRICGSFLYLVVVHGWFTNTALGSIVNDSNTGGVMEGAGGLLTTLYITFFVGVLFMPLLTHFGAVEFIGILVGSFVEKVFRVPGYSAVDALASFVGDGTIGIIVTDNQYKRGYYSRREAYIIATSFSIVGIAFASAVAEELGFAEIFPVFYGTIAFITVVLAFITSRMPLKKYGHTYYNGVKPKRVQLPENMNRFQYAYNTATNTAEKASFSNALREAFKGILSIYTGFLPVIMIVGTFSLIIAENTSVFHVIATPLVPIYEWLGYSKDVAVSMGAASFVGIADMYLPSIFISGTPSESARFFIGVLAFTQLVFMSETGMILVESKIGLNVMDVVKVFLFRTLFSIPLLFLITRVLIWLDLIAF